MEGLVLEGRKKLQGYDVESLIVYELLIGLDIQHDGMFSSDFVKRVRTWDEPERERQLRAAVARDWRKYPKLMARKCKRIRTILHSLLCRYTRMKIDNRSLCPCAL